MGVTDEIRAALNADPRQVTEIAELAGISRVHLSRFKHGSRELSPDLLERLAGVLGGKLLFRAKRKRAK